MAKYILQELPEKLSNGKKVIFPKMDNYTMFNDDEVIEKILSQEPSLHKGTIRSVMEAFIQAMKTCLPLGHPMKIKGLGIFSLSLEFDTSTPSESEIAKRKKKGINDDPKTSYRHIRIKKINFKPDAELINAMNRETDFERATSEVVAPKKEMYSLAERVAKALEIIEKKGYMTLTDFTIATSQSRSSASNDLKNIVSSTDSPITIRGSHSHKVWVKKRN